MSITQVAKLAGVSIATVSRVINNRRWVAPATAEAVRIAIRQSGYTPPPPEKRIRGRSAALLAGLRTGCIALLFPDPDAIAMKTVLSGRLSHGINEELSKHGLSLIISRLANWDRMPQCIERSQVDGVIVRGAAPVEHVLPLLRSAACVTVFETSSVPSRGDHVLEDTTAIGELAASYLLGRGCKHLASLNRDPLHPAYSSRGDAFAKSARYAGFDVAMINAAAPYPELIQLLMKTLPHPTGLFVPGNDDEVANIYRELENQGVVIGRDIQIISCNYDAARLGSLDPGLANIDIQPELIGQSAAELLLWRLRNPSAPRRRLLVAPLLVEPAIRA